MSPNSQTRCAPCAAIVESVAESFIRKLMEDGFLIIPDAAEPALLGALYADLDPHFLEAPFGKGLFYGETTKRFGRVLARSPRAADLILHPLILAIVERVLADRGGIQLNLSQAIEIHPTAPVQIPHRDHEMWPVEKNGGQFMVNVMWALDDFTAENGATRIWPGSHRSEEVILPDQDAIDAIAGRGSAILFLGGTLHSGGANRSSWPRRGLIFSYCQGWLMPDENPWLAYPPKLARSFSPDLAALVGYRQRFAGLNNYEGQCPSVLLKRNQPSFYPFADDMSPEQTARIHTYYERLEQRTLV